MKRFVQGWASLLSVLLLGIANSLSAANDDWKAIEHSLRIIDSDVKETVEFSPELRTKYFLIDQLKTEVIRQRPYPNRSKYLRMESLASYLASIQLGSFIYDSLSSAKKSIALPIISSGVQALSKEKDRIVNLTLLRTVSNDEPSIEIAEEALLEQLKQEPQREVKLITDSYKINREYNQELSSKHSYSKQIGKAKQSERIGPFRDKADGFNYLTLIIDSVVYETSKVTMPSDIDKTESVDLSDRLKLNDPGNRPIAFFMDKPIDAHFVEMLQIAYPRFHFTENRKELSELLTEALVIKAEKSVALHQTGIRFQQNRTQQIRAICEIYMNRWLAPQFGILISKRFERDSVAAFTACHNEGQTTTKESRYDFLLAIQNSSISQDPQLVCNAFNSITTYDVDMKVKQPNFTIVVQSNVPREQLALTFPDLESFDLLSCRGPFYAEQYTYPVFLQLRKQQIITKTVTASQHAAYCRKALAERMLNTLNQQIEQKARDLSNK